MQEVLFICAVAYCFYLTAAADSGNCTVPEVSNGEIFENKPVYFFNWRKVGYEWRNRHVKSPVGTILLNGTHVFLDCNGRFNSTRNISALTRTRCIHGKLLPEPDCRNLSGYCSGQLPSLINGKSKNINRQNGSLVEYECNNGYGMIGKSSVRCESGKWTGYLPVCIFYSCIVPKLPRGELRKLKIKDHSLDRNNSPFRRRVVNIELLPGTIFPNGSTVTLFCPTNISVERGFESLINLHCFNGDWLPCPVCPDLTRRYPPRFRPIRPFITLAPIKTGRRRIMNISSSESANSNLEPISIEAFETPTPTTETMPTSKIHDCECEYPISDENLVAYANGEILEFRDKVKNGSIVVFLCKNPLIHHLNGAQNVKCDGCQKWSTSDFPTCSEQKQDLPRCQVNVANSSELIVEPIKEYYRMGEFIFVSCPVGKKLTRNVVRIMCTGTTWSDILPGCF